MVGVSLVAYPVPAAAADAPADVVEEDVGAAFVVVVVVGEVVGDTETSVAAGD